MVTHKRDDPFSIYVMIMGHPSLAHSSSLALSLLISQISQKSHITQHYSWAPFVTKKQSANLIKKHHSVIDFNFSYTHLPPWTCSNGDKRGEKEWNEIHDNHNFCCHSFIFANCPVSRPCHRQEQKSCAYPEKGDKNDTI